MAFNKFYISQQDASDATQIQRVLNTVQQNVETAIKTIENLTILDKIILEDVSINTSTTVEHRLGRVPTGYLVILKSANANIWNGAITSTQITFNSSAAVTATIYIF